MSKTPWLGLLTLVTISGFFICLFLYPTEVSCPATSDLNVIEGVLLDVEYVPLRSTGVYAMSFTFEDGRTIILKSWSTGYDLVMDDRKALTSKVVMFKLGQRHVIYYTDYNFIQRMEIISD